MQMRCKCNANAMQCKCKCECKCKRKCNANAMQMQCNANANANATRCNTRRAMSILTINLRVELACAFSALFVKTQSIRCNVMQCHAMQSDRETQNHYATRFDTTRFACIFGITSHCNAIILNVCLHIVFALYPFAPCRFAPLPLAPLPAPCPPRPLRPLVHCPHCP